MSNQEFTYTTHNENPELSDVVLNVEGNSVNYLLGISFDELCQVFGEPIYNRGKDDFKFEVQWHIKLQTTNVTSHQHIDGSPIEITDEINGIIFTPKLVIDVSENITWTIRDDSNAQGFGQAFFKETMRLLAIFPTP
jgi:hypothetical protein